MRCGGSRAQGTAVKAVPMGPRHRGCSQALPRTPLPGFPGTGVPRPSPQHPEFEALSRPPHVSVDLGQPGGAMSPEVKAASWAWLRSVGAGRSEPQGKDTVAAGAAGRPRPSSGLSPARAPGPGSDTVSTRRGTWGAQLGGPTRGAEASFLGEAGVGSARARGPGGRGGALVRDDPAQRPVAEARGQAPGALGLRLAAPRSHGGVSQAQLSRASGLRLGAGVVLPDRASPGVLPDPRTAGQAVTSAPDPTRPLKPSPAREPRAQCRAGFPGGGGSPVSLPPWRKPALGPSPPRPRVRGLLGPKLISRLHVGALWPGRLGHDTLGDLGPGLPACTRGWGPQGASGHAVGAAIPQPCSSS